MFNNQNHRIMDNLFLESDFSLFTQYQGKTQEEAPEGHQKLRSIYDKLGKVIDKIKELGYPAEINRNPLIQGGPSTFKYCEYHWSKVYPLDEDLAKECWGNIFVVIGTTERGINIHIDSNSRHGYDSDSLDLTYQIKENTGIVISPNEAAQYSSGQLAQMVADFYTDNWKQFNLFAREFGIQRSIKILDNMEIDNIKNLLISNHNLILTGAPGTGKTYLAKKIAESMGAEHQLVQFHPSYDYTDFVEGLRPVNQKGQIVFERKDGVFKAFCKLAFNVQQLFDLSYDNLVADLKCGFEKVNTESRTAYVNTENRILFRSSDGREAKDEKHGVSKEKLALLYNKIFENLSDINDENDITKAKCTEFNDGKGVDTNAVALLKEIFRRSKADLRRLKANPYYVFIIDEINRGEVSKIFGELFFAIDPGYRGEKGRVNTQYQNLISKEDPFERGFFVPENVYIIGTMNDIDRSVESMDFAMRRRFAWKEISAKSRQSMLDETETWGKLGKPSQDTVNEIKARMDNLNNCIIDQYGEETYTGKDRIGLTKAYQIGASYFLKYNQYNNFDELWDNHIEGLLYEYLRGTTNIEAKIERLKKAYNDTEAH